MPPKKKIKLEDKNVYDDDLDYSTYESAVLTANDFTMIDIVNYLWKVNYKVVRDNTNIKVEIFVDFASRYSFEDKVSMEVTVEAGGEKFEDVFDLAKERGQKFEVVITEKDDAKIKDKDIKVTCEIDVTGAEYNAKNEGTRADFKHPRYPHDVVLLVGDTKFYVHKTYLAKWSKYFNALFYGEAAEKDKTEAKIEDVDIGTFDKLLHIIHPSLYISIDDDNVLEILKLASRFEMPSVISMCGSYLSHFAKKPSLSLMDRLELSDKHNISHLQVACLKEIHKKSAADLKAFQDENRERIKNLSYNTLKNLT